MILGASNPVGVSSGINYVGDHAYAHSGPVTVADATDAQTTLLEFTIGASYIMAEIHLFNNQASSLDDFVNVTINGELIVQSRYQNANELHQDQPLKILIPPYSTFKIGASTAGATPTFSAVLTGRVYS